MTERLKFITSFCGTSWQECILWMGQKVSKTRVRLLQRNNNAHSVIDMWENIAVADFVVSCWFVGMEWYCLSQPKIISQIKSQKRAHTTEQIQQSHCQFPRHLFEFKKVHWSHNLLIRNEQKKKKMSEPDKSDITTLDATYLVAKEARTALEETRKARAKVSEQLVCPWNLCHSEVEVLESPLSNANRIFD